MNRSIVLAAGGTGGHLYPAFSLAEALEARGFAPFFLGHGLGGSPFFRQERWPFLDVAGAPFRLGYRTLLPFLAKSCRGLSSSITLYRRLAPALVVGFGSYHTLAPLLGATLLRLPLLLFESNRIPGRMIRLFSPYARKVACSLPLASLPISRATYVRYPLRRSIQQSMEKKHGLDYFALSPFRTTILCFGGSQGAHALYRLLQEAIPLLSTPIQLILFYGQSYDPIPLQKLLRQCSIPFAMKAQEERMEMAYAAADFAICRAGSATVAELIHARLPSLLIPYPHAQDDHQRWNGQFLEEQGGALLAKESTLTGEKLARIVEEVVSSLQRRSAMREALERMDRDFPREELADLVEELLGERGG